MENTKKEKKEYTKDSLDDGIITTGFLEVLPDGFGFIRNANYLSDPHDVYVSQSQIYKFKLKTGDFITGVVREPKASEKFRSHLHIQKINHYDLETAMKRKSFESLTPIFPNEKISVGKNGKIAMRMIDLLAPIGKGQRGIIVSPPKAGKTTLLKDIALAVKENNKDIHILILLIDERPEEVTDIKEAVEGDNVEVLYSTFDETPDRHKKVSEMVIERAKRLVEHGQDVMILLDSITRLTRSYNLICSPSGRTLSGGLDPNCLYMPKRFFGAARNMREGGSLTILATALVDTGSRMDDVIYEEFKGTGNMELVLSRAMQEKRIFPAIDIAKSGTRREDLLLSEKELQVNHMIHYSLNGTRASQNLDDALLLFRNTKNNDELIESSKIKWQSFLKGDDDAYAWLYSRYVQQLYQYGCRFTTDTEMVKDCVQDVFVNVYRQKDRYSSPPDNVKIYLMSSLRNSIFNVFNKGNLHDTYISNINYEFDLSVEEKLIETEDETSQKHTVAHLLNTLSPRQREIIYYRFFEGLDYSAICELMGLNYQSAYNLLQRSLSRLREMYGILPFFFLF